MSASDPHPLESLARRVRGDSFFVASALADYQRRHGLDDARLVDQLGCSASALPRLALCRRPVAADPEFAARVRRIAAYVTCHADVLLLILRESSALAALRGAPPPDVSTPLFTAARDHQAKQDASRNDEPRDDEGPT